MPPSFIDFVIFILAAVQLLLFVIFLLMRGGKNHEPVFQKLAEYEKKLDKNEVSLKDEFSRNRDESNKSARISREELQSALKSNREEQLAALRFIREELSKTLREFGDVFSKNFEKNRETIEKKLTDIQTDNSAKLEKMRETVDEKLHKTLEARLGDSFKLVSERLELVQKGLGEMQSLAAGVGDLKKVLSNVKTKGVFGEYQLGGILEEMLSPNQYAVNVKTKAGSNDIVEYAVKIPSKENSEKVVWLPIDSKFPTETYERLNAAYDTGDVPEIEKNKKELEKTIKLFAKDIKTKYIDPPNTTDFAIMFLPFESLYAEVLRIHGLFDVLQRDYKITITGPTTISAFLNSLRMGFRSLAVEKRTSEIWEVLGAVRTEFGKFADILDAAKKKLDAASDELAKTRTRTKMIERKLKNVESLPEQQAFNVLELNSDSAGLNLE
ncbi:MAG: DNA recombination protein RmuC [Spirochaetaceae bacterium]|jgi:DNA recombination protein RmuC|nr:DNA recombination protein RmuC [Spirochaetaceae bacterium]